MDLKSYLDTLKRADREAFAIRCGTTLGHITNVANGFRSCRESLAIEIERESAGEVRCETLCPGVDWQFVRNTV